MARIVTFDDLPGWSFTVDEVSVGVYVVRGIASDGISIELKGTDPDALLDKCRTRAAEFKRHPPREKR